jgi:hypothetical protein
MKTKSFFFVHILTILFFTFPLYSQDLIILKTGDEIQSVVTEVDLNVIRYKKFENINGPVYTIEVSKVFMIKYENGTKDVFNASPEVQPQLPQAAPPVEQIVQDAKPQPLEYRSGIRMNGKKLTDAEIRSLLMNYPEPLNYYNQAVSLAMIGSISQWSVIGVGIYTAIKARPLDPPESELVAKRGVIAMGALVVGWLTFGGISGSKARQTVSSYNSMIKSPMSYQFQFFIKDNQAGLAMRF